MNTQDSNIPQLPKGTYFDEQKLLRLADGRYIEDGVYLTQEGEVFLYEGIFETFPFGEVPPPTVSIM